MSNSFHRPYPPFRIHTASHKLFPVSARDENGTDLLPSILKQDDQYVAALTRQNIRAS